MDKDNNQPTPKHVQIENAKKPEKKYVIFYELDGKNLFTNVNNINQAFLKTVELKSQGVTKIVVYQEIELKITVH